MVYNKQQQNNKVLLSEDEQLDFRRNDNSRRDDQRVQSARARDIEVAASRSRGEINHDRDRNTTQESPRRSGRAANQRRRKPSTSLAESAIQVEEKRNRAIEKVRKSRERIYKQYVKSHEDLRARHQEYSRAVQEEYQSSISTEQSVKSSFISSITTIAKRLREFAKQFIEKVKEVFKAPEPEQKEKEKAPEEVALATTAPEEVDQDEFKKMMKELKEANEINEKPKIRGLKLSL